MTQLSRQLLWHLQRQNYLFRGVLHHYAKTRVQVIINRTEPAFSQVIEQSTQQSIRAFEQVKAIQLSLSTYPIYEHHSQEGDIL